MRSDSYINDPPYYMLEVVLIFYKEYSWDEYHLKANKKQLEY